jgi:hypothetical protein
MSISNYKRYVICPVCRNELKADGLLAHFRRAHKKALSASEMAEMLSGIAREPSRKPNRPRDLEKYAKTFKAQDKKQFEATMRKLKESTPDSMRGWDPIRDGIPRRIGPVGPEKH